MVVLWLAIFALIAAIDLRTRRIPDLLLLGASLVAVGQATTAGAFAEASVAGAGALAFFWMLRRLSVRNGRAALGLGDVKLAGLIGLVCGASLPLALLVGTGAGALAALVLLAAGRRRTDFFPYGSTLALGAAVVIIATQRA